MGRLLLASLLLGLAASPAAPQITTLGSGATGTTVVTLNVRVTNSGDIRVTNTPNTRVAR